MTYSHVRSSFLLLPECALCVLFAGGRLIPSRFVVVLLGFFSCVTLNAQRGNLSMALVTMVNHTALKESAEGNATFSECPAGKDLGNDTGHPRQKIEGTYLWDAETQNHIISASFLGYVLTQTPGGRVAENLGAKQVLIFSLIMASLCNIFSPLACDWGPYALLAVQFIKGLTQGLTQPSFTCLMAKWYPKPEKGFLSSLTFSGYPTGNMLGGLISGALCNMGEWPWVFYVFGLNGLILAVFVHYFAHNCPEDDDKMTDVEYEYIFSNMEVKDTSQRYKTPWKQIILSAPTWAVAVGMFGQYWMLYYFIQVQPAYLKNALHFSHIEIGYLNSLPFIGLTVVTWVSSYLSDVVVNRGYSSVDIVRKTCNSISTLGFSCCLIGVTYAGCDNTLNAIYFALSVIFVGFGYPGSSIVPLDMTISFAGTLMGFTCTTASMAGFIMPLVVGWITSKEQSLARWHLVLYLSAGVSSVCGLFFALLGSAKLQSWDSPTSSLTGLVNDAFDDRFGDPGSSRTLERIQEEEPELADVRDRRL